MSFNKIYSQVILPISNQVLFFFDSIWRPPEDWRYQCWHLYGVGILKIYFYFVKNFTIINSCGNLKRLNSWKILNLLRPGAILTKLLMFKMSMNRQQKLGLILQSLQFIQYDFNRKKVLFPSCNIQMEGNTRSWKFKILIHNHIQSICQWYNISFNN